MATWININRSLKSVLFNCRKSSHYMHYWEKPCEKHVNFMWKPCENFTWVSQGFHMVFHTLFHRNVKYHVKWPCEIHVKYMWNGLHIFTWHFTELHVKNHVKKYVKQKEQGRLIILWKRMWKILPCEIPCEIGCENLNGYKKRMQFLASNWNSNYGFVGII